MHAYRTFSRKAFVVFGAIAAWALALSPAYAGANRWTPVYQGSTDPLRPAIGMIGMAVSPEYATDHTVLFTSESVLYKVVGSSVPTKVVDGAGAGPVVDSIYYSPTYAADHTIIGASGLQGSVVSIDGGANWTSRYEGSLAPSTFALSPAFATDRTMFGWSDRYDGLGFSTDSGHNWTKLLPGMRGTELIIDRVRFAPTWASDRTACMIGRYDPIPSESYLMRTTDGGAAFRAVAPVQAGRSYSDMAFSTDYASDRAVFATSSRNVSGGGVTRSYWLVHRSTDGMATWTAMLTGPRYARRIFVSPTFATDRTLLAICDYRFDNLTDGRAVGLSISTDAGVTWHPLNTGLEAYEAWPGLHVWMDVAFSPAFASDRTIFVASAGAADDSGVKLPSALFSITLPPDATPPAPVNTLASSLGASGRNLVMTWRDPSDTDFAGVYLLRSARNFARSPLDRVGQVVAYEGPSRRRYTAVESLAGGMVVEAFPLLTGGRRYYYTLWAADSAGNWSGPVKRLVTTTKAVATRPSVLFYRDSRGLYGNFRGAFTKAHPFATDVIFQLDRYRSGKWRRAISYTIPVKRGMRTFRMPGRSGLGLGPGRWRARIAHDACAPLGHDGVDYHTTSFGPYRYMTFR